MHGAVPPPEYVFTAWCLIKHRNNFTLPNSKSVLYVWNIGIKLLSNWMPLQNVFFLRIELQKIVA